MTTEELLRARYEVIEDYPGSDYEVGEIVQMVDPNCDGENFHSINEDGEFLEWQRFYDEYPKIFRKLQWWEERKPEEMPIYLKSISDSLQMVIGGIYKVKNYHKDIRKYGVFIEGKSFSRLIETLMPATEAEYLEYKKHHQPPH